MYFWVFLFFIYFFSNFFSWGFGVFCSFCSLIFSLSSLDVIVSFSSLNTKFISMLFCVVSLVCLYSVFYMDGYNFKKFIFLLFLFMFSMIFLVHSGSGIFLIFSWDFLGFTSIFLIIFYPNKLTSYNSWVTIFFNRLGDVIMISFFCFLFSFSKVLLSSCDYSLVLLLLFICSFTKSAQFPLSCWLPAAMAAPTPISAMVHSSTLVTAGIFLISKFVGSFYLSVFYIFPNVFILSFTLSAFLAVLELDLKKVVAYSTMSQISMILLVLSWGYRDLAVFHMMLHAFFKTLMFCSVGYFFFSLYGEQEKGLMSFKFVSLFGSCLLTGSCYSMSGYLFSASFYSKDYCIENFLCDSFYFNSFSFFIILGSFLTICYCCVLMGSVFSKISKISVFNFSLENYFYGLFFFIYPVSVMGEEIFNMTYVEGSPSLSLMDFILVVFCVLFPIFLSAKMLLNDLFYQFSIDSGYMKFFSFSMFSSFSPSSVYISDFYFFKINNFFGNNGFLYLFGSWFYWIYLLFFLILLIY